MNKKQFTISEVIDSFGITKHSWVLFIILSLAQVLDGYDFMIINSTNLFVAHTFWPNDPNPGALMGSLTTWGLLGMVIGGAFGGILSDKIGRKKVLIGAVAFYGVFTLPQAFASDLTMFAAFRLIAGLGVGSCIPVVYTVFSEVMPSNRRGFFITCGGACMVGGWVIAGLVANPICNAATPLLGGFTEMVTYTNADGTTATMFSNWRLCYLIGGIPILYAIFLAFAMRETTHWYANTGQTEKAIAVLAEFEMKSVGTSTKRDPNAIIIPPRPEKTTPNVLFSKKFIVGTSAIWTVCFVGQFCVYGMNAWLPTWFKSIGYSASDAVALQTWNNVAAIISNCLVGYVSDTMGRKKCLIFAWILCIVVIIACSLFVTPDSFIICAVLMLAFGFELNFAISAIYPLMPEQYPTAIRNTGTAWCQAFARFGGSASSIVLGGIATMAIFQAGGTTNWSSVVLTLIIPFALGLICTLVFVRDTYGKSLDMLTSENSGSNDSGTAPFAIMMCIVVILFALCIICPLAIPNWSKLPIALPLMACGMLLPFLFFFILGGKQLIAEKARKQ